MIKSLIAWLITGEPQLIIGLCALVLFLILLFKEWWF